MTNSIFAELEAFNKVMQEHADKIAPVLRSLPPTPANGEKAQPDEYLVPVADSLRNIQRRIIGLRAALEDMTARTEA